MSSTRLERLSAASTSEICHGVDLGDEVALEVADGRLRTDASPGAFFDALLAADHLNGALIFLAHALPKREAVWWSAQCVREFAGEGAGLAAAEAWVREPTDAVRRQAMEVATGLEFAHADAWVAVAAFWAEGSLALLDQPELAPDPGLTAKAAVGAIGLAIAAGGEDAIPERQRRCAQIGVEVSNGIKRWE